MESRFTFKDFVFVVLFVVVIGAVVWSIYQSGYQESRLNDLKKQLVVMADGEKQQLEVLSDIRNTLKSGVSMKMQGTGSGSEAATTSASATSGRVRRTNPDGSQYVCYPDVPLSPRDPEKQPDYATGDWLIQNVGMEPAVIAPFIEKDVAGQQIHEPAAGIACGVESTDFGV